MRLLFYKVNLSEVSLRNQVNSVSYALTGNNHHHPHTMKITLWIMSLQTRFNIPVINLYSEVVDKDSAVLEIDSVGPSRGLSHRAH